MQQKQKLGINFGFRGWMLLVAEATAFLMFQAFSNFPMNMTADFYGGAQLLSTMYTVGTLVGIVIQLILSGIIGKVKNVKVLTLIMGCITILAALGIMTIKPGPAWKVCYFVFNVFSIIYAMFGLGILIGQWFPTRKGVFMGIATFAFPICNGLMGPFSGWVNIGAAMGTAYASMEMGVPNFEGAFAVLNVTKAFLPFLCAGLLGWLLILIFIKDYPEQVGSYRDNDKNMTPEIANAMMMQEIENKKTTVWKTGKTLATSQFWFITVPMGTLLMCSVGMMTQTQSIIGAYNLPFEAIMGIVMICALLGSYILGLIDTAFGSKRAVTISVVIMLLSGILGGVGQTYTTVVAIVLLAIFMGAASNFTVSAAAQYWRREDFPSVFAVVNPIANVIQSLGPVMVAMTMSIGVTEIGKINATMPFWAIAVISVISLILVLCFKPTKVKERDDDLRSAAGKVLDDALVGRK